MLRHLDDVSHKYQEKRLVKFVSEVTMEFGLTPEQQQLEKGLRDYLEKMVPPGMEEELETEYEGGGPIHKKFVKQLGADGWLGIGWPKEHGGQGRSPIEQYIFYDLAEGYYYVHLPLLGLNTVGPTIMQVGTPEQKRRFLPGILKGELDVAIGYTEPEAGSDLASLKTTAVKEGDQFIINGQKFFTSQAEFCDYIWLAARTDAQAPKHKGISIFMIDAKTPGITIEPMLTMSALKTNYTFYENVRVPKECLIGEENRGWLYINQQLARERMSLAPHSRPLRYFEYMMDWCKRGKLSKTSIMERALVKNQLMEMIIETEVLKLLNYRVAWMLTQGRVPHPESAMLKVFGSEQIQRVLDRCFQMMGLCGQLQTGSKWAPFRGKVEQYLRFRVQFTFGGGANEILRDIIATGGLGLPRA